MGNGVRQPVTRQRAILAAVALVDAGGLDSLSMRKLAGSLGVEAMSLYHHVTSKDDLLDGMMEHVLDEIPLPEIGGLWRPAMRARADSTRAVLTRHPWVIPLMDTRSTEATLRHHDATIGCLLASGFSLAMVNHAVSVLDSYVVGFALQETALPFDEHGDISAVTEEIMAQRTAMAETFPHLTRLAVEHVLQPGYAYGNEFEFGIELLLDGIAARLG